MEMSSSKLFSKSMDDSYVKLNHFSESFCAIPFLFFYFFGFSDLRKVSNAWWGKNFFITRSTLKCRHMQNRFGPLSPRKRRGDKAGDRGVSERKLCARGECWIIQRMLINILCNTRTADIDLKFRNCCCGLRLQAGATLRGAARRDAAWRFIEMPLAHFNGATGVHAAYAQSAECRIEARRVEFYSASRRASILQIFCYCSSANININVGIV